MPGTPRSVLVLGGTREATALAERLAENTSWRVMSSLAGRTRSPDLPAGETRIGGFGGVEGLAEYLASENIDLLVDATHPFADTITRNAMTAAARTGTRLLRLERPAWSNEPGDLWTSVASEEEASAAIPKDARVFLALGRQYVDAFAGRGDVHFVLRMVDRPDRPLPFADCDLLIGKPSPDVETEAAMLQERGITLIVCRNSGGRGSYAKIAAARQLSLPVIMIERPQAPRGQTFATVDALMDAID